MSNKYVIRAPVCFTHCSFQHLHPPGKRQKNTLNAKVRSHTPPPESVCLCFYDSFSPFARCLLCPKFYFELNSPPCVTMEHLDVESETVTHIHTMLLIFLSPFPPISTTSFSLPVVKTWPPGQGLFIRDGVG